MKKNKASFGVNIGSASILLIFVLLCLISFATLSIVSANADSKLTKKVLERTTAYYEACSQAHITLAELDSYLSDAYKASSDKEQYFQTVGHKRFFEFPISDVQHLIVQLEILYPETAEDTFYQISVWNVVQEKTD